MGHRHRLDLVVRDVDRRHAEVVLELRDLGPHLDAELRVEVRERLVHQEDLRLADDRPAQRDALALAARELLGLRLEVGCQVEELRPPRRRARRCRASAILRRRRPKAMLSATVMCGYSA